MKSNGDDPLYQFAMKMASSFCRRRSLRGGQRDDVLQDMLVGMSQATVRYDADRGVPFEAYARKRMFGEAMDGLVRRGGIPRPYWAQGIRCPKPLIEETLTSSGRFVAADMEPPAVIQRAYKTLDGISPLLKRVVEALQVEQLPAAEVALSLGLSKTHVRELSARGVQLLRYKLRNGARGHRKVIMDSTKPANSLSAARWRTGLRKTVREPVTPEVIQQLVLRQIELAKAGDRHALNFLLKQCGLNEIHGQRSNPRNDSIAGVPDECS